MLSVKKEGPTVCIRLHRMFLSAGDNVLHDVAAFIKHRNRSTPLLREFIRQNTHRIKEAPRKKQSLRQKGRYHDLGVIYDTLHSSYFGSSLSSSITWGHGRSRNRVKKRTLGSYSRQTNTIRINPVLDRKTVPAYFVEFVVFHEMLHADMAVHERNGRRQIHSKPFRRREKLFRYYDMAMAWEKKKWF